MGAQRMGVAPVSTLGTARPDPWDEMSVERRVLELHMAGYSFTYIARELDLPNHQAAHQAYLRAAKRSEQPNRLALDEKRDLEADRLDRLQLAVWPQAIRGDLPSVDRSLRIMDQRSKLLGLNHSDGVAERQVRLDEQTGGMVLQAISRVLERVGLTAAQRALADAAVPVELRALMHTPAPAGEPS